MQPPSPAPDPAETPPPSSVVPRSGRRQRVRKILSFLAWGVIGMIALVGAAVAAVLGAAQTEAGRAYLVQTLQDVVSESAGMTLQLEGLAPGIPVHLAFDRLSLADADGVWLSVEGFDFRWLPSELMSGTFAVANLAADRIAVDRLPLAGEPVSEPEPSEPAKLSLPSLPIDVRLDRLAVGTLALAAPVMGQSATFAIDGRLGAKAEQSIESDLSLRRTDAGSLRAAAAAHFDPATTRLQLDFKFDEGAGGLVATLAGLEGAPPLALSLVGDGLLAAWDGRLELLATDLVSVEAAVRLRGDDGHVVQVDGSGRWPGKMPAFIPPIIGPALADGITFNADVNLGDGGPIDIRTLTVRGSDLSLAAKGQIDSTDDRLALTVDASLGAGALARQAMAGYALTSAEAHVVAEGAVSAPTVHGSGAVEDVRGPNASLRSLRWTASVLPEGESEATRTQQLRLAATINELALSDPALQPLIGPVVGLSAGAQLDPAQSVLRLAELSLTTAAARLSGGGVIALNDGDSKLDLTLNADDLNQFTPLAGMPLAGRGQVTTTVTGPLSQGRLTAAIAAGLTDFATRDAVVQSALGSHPKLTGDVHFDQATGLEVPNLRFVGQALEAKASAALSEGFSVLGAQLDAEVPDLAPLGKAAGTPASGRLRLTAHASGAIADPAADLAVELANGQLSGTAVRIARIEASARTVISRPTGQLRLDAETGEGPVIVSASFAKRSADAFDVRDLRASLLGLRAEGDVTLGLQSGLVTGRIVGGLPASGFPQAHSIVRGDGTFEIGLAPERRMQSVDVRVRGAGLHVVGEAGDTATLETLRLDANVADAFGTPRLEAKARLGGIRAASEGPFVAALDANGTPADLAFSVALTGPKANLSAADLTGRVKAAGGAMRIELAQFRARIGETPLDLRQPLVVTSGGGLSVEGLDLAVGDGSLQGQIATRPGVTEASLRGEGLPLALIKPWAPGIPSGQLAVSADLRGHRSEIAGPFQLRLDNLRLANGQSAKEALGHVRVDGTLGGGALETTGEAHVADGLSANFHGRLPMTIPAGELAARLSPQVPLDAQLSLRGDLAKLAGVLAFADQRLAGAIAMDASVAGTLDHPIATGAVSLKDGLYENFVTGTLLTGIDGQVDIARSDLISVVLSSKTKGGGRIDVNGNASLAAAGGPAIDLAVTANQAQLVHRDDAVITTNASLRYLGGLTHGALSGSINPTSIQIRLLDRLPPGVVEIPVIEINRPGGDKTEPPKSSGAPWVGDLDVGIDMPRRVFVRGRGLESEWGGKLQLRGTTNVPRLTGDIGIIRGVFTFASKRFDIEKGTITFTGGQPIDPVLNMQANYKTKDLTAIIGVTGTASAPQLNVTSTPSLPESEVMARVLFDKSSASLGPVEAVQLALAIDTLARGESWSEDTLGSIRQFLGLDVLNVDTSSSTDSDNGGAAVEVGRYVTEGVYVGAKRGITESTTDGRVEVEITPSISVQSDLTQSAEGMSGSIGLRWKHDY